MSEVLDETPGDRHCPRLGVTGLDTRTALVRGAEGAWEYGRVILALDMHRVCMSLL